METAKRFGAVVALGAALGLVMALAPRATGAESDESVVKARAAAFVTAWNEHDPKAVAAIFAEDGDAINPMGRAASNRAGVEKLLTEEHSGEMRECTLAFSDEKVRFPTRDVAIYDAEGTMTNVMDDKGTKMSHDIHVTFVWRKDGETWNIFSARPYMKPKPEMPKPGTEPVGNK